MKKCSLILVLLNCFCFGQNHLSQQLQLTVDNDKIVFTDKYYSSGLFLDYKKNLSKDFLFLKAEESSNQLQVTLGSEIYTPTLIWSTNTTKFDRPYAGWSFLKTALHQIKSNRSNTYSVEIGFTGQMSFAGKFQSWWHKAIDVGMPTWTQEIENKFLVNFKTEHVFNYKLYNNVAFQYRLQPSLGLKDIYLENNASLYIGQLNPFKTSSRSGVINKAKEFYGVLGIGHRFVAHNTLIQGGVRYNDKTFTSSVVRHLLQLNSGLVYKTERHLWQFGLYFNTKETPKSTSHTYGRLSYGFLF